MTVEDRVNKHLEQAEYAVRGKITQIAADLEKQLQQSDHGLPFDKLIYCNLGNPQALRQTALTFPRQVLACCECPELLENDAVVASFPADVITRAKDIRSHVTLGAYTASVGHPYLRKLVASGLEKRDGHPADPEKIILSNGASASVHAMLETMIDDEDDAFLVPVPQYPLYSASLTLYGGTMLSYFLKEEADWAVDIDEVARIINDAKRGGKRVRGMVVINPGNPTGQVLSLQNQVDLLKLCASEGVPIIADEVYQANIWAEDRSFTSFKKAALDAGVDACIFSLHSISKGFYGECGQRGGIMELHNVGAKVESELKKLLSINLCSNTPGQILATIMMSPPAEGDASYQSYSAERAEKLASLKRRARKLSSALQKVDGISCTSPQGALYVFPQLHLPQGAHKEASRQGVSPDFFYCQELLTRTGIVTVPGSGFKQVEGTYHFRMTILPPEDEMDDVVSRMTSFQEDFLRTWA